MKLFIVETNLVSQNYFTTGESLLPLQTQCFYAGLEVSSTYLFDKLTRAGSSSSQDNHIQSTLRAAEECV